MDLSERSAQLAKQNRDHELHVGLGPRQGTREVRFRGTWYVSIREPAFNAFMFLPVPPAMEPRKAPEKKVVEEEVVEDAEPPAVEATVVEPEEPEEEPLAEMPDEIRELQDRDRLSEPPADAEILLTIRDRYRDYRAHITPDGTCVNSVGDIIGYINTDTDEAGSTSEEYLGSLEGDRFTNVLTVKDATDEVCGTLDQGTALIKDCRNATVAELRASGELYGNLGTYLGAFEGYRYREMKIVALYCVLIDPGMLKEDGQD